jgi:helix-turn-helix protein
VEENTRFNGEFGDHCATVVRAYCELMDEVIPHLPPAEQSLYLRLFRLSHVQQSPFTKCRYEELAAQCGLSLSTVRRAVKGLRAKRLIKTVWESKSGTTFAVQMLSTFPPRPDFLPRRGRGSSPSLQRPSRPPLYDAFTPEDRALFIDCKQRLGPVRLNALTETAVEWLSERCGGDPEAFSDDLLRDKVDALVFEEIFGPARRKPYAHLFAHLDQADEQAFRR